MSPTARVVQIALLLLPSVAPAAPAAVSDAERALINAAARPGIAHVSAADQRATDAQRGIESAKQAREVALLRDGLARADARGDVERAAAFRAALLALVEDAPAAAAPRLPMTPSADGVNIMPYVSPGWTADLVARSDVVPANTPVILPDTLASGSASTYVSIGGTNAGTLPTGAGFSDSLYLDGVALGSMAWPAWDPGYVGHAWNEGPHAVRGGRHTLSLVRDAGQQVVESDESDNRTDAQYVWAPPMLESDIPVVRAYPPARGDQPLPNGDGFRASALWWSAVAVTPASGSDDVDLLLYKDYSGATDGYSRLAVASQSGAGLTDIAIVNGNSGGFGLTSYPAVLSTATTGSDYVIESCQPYLTTAGGHIGPHTLGVNALLRFYELDLAAGEWSLRVVNSGPGTLDIALVGPGQIYSTKTGAMALVSLPPGGGEVILPVSVPAHAFYGLAAFKHGAGDVSSTVRFEVFLDATPPVITSLAANPGGWSRTNQFTFTWNAVDPETDVIYSDYHTTGGDTRTTDFSVANVTAPSEGESSFFVRCTNGVLGTSAYASVAYRFDATEPASTVDVLPDTTWWTAPLTVSWRGTDAASGIASYDVQYRLLPDGAWTDWRPATGETSHRFGPVSPEIVQQGQTYAFRTRARDAAGNVEAWPANDSLGDAAVVFDTTSGPPPELDPLDETPSLLLSPPRPSPVSTTLYVDFTLYRAGSVRAEVVDIFGRIVRVLDDTQRSPGYVHLTWDLRDGVWQRPVPASLYIVRVIPSDGRAAWSRVLVVR